MSDTACAMPKRPLRPCSMPGCPELVTSGACPAHQRPGPKKSGDPFYSSKPWRALRARRLRLSPFCSCGCQRRADTVDHIKPRRLHPELELDLANTQSFYSRCHNRKTASQDGGFGNRTRTAPTAVQAPTPAPTPERRGWVFA